MSAEIVAADAELAEYAASFAAWCFRELNPRTRFAANWHVEVMAGKLAAVYHGRSRRLIVSVPPRHLKSQTRSRAREASSYQ
jgi:hypothetical protein